MLMAELSQRTGLPVATLKFYLRDGLLHPGVAVSRTRAEYDDGHVERVRLVRALVEVGGLDLATVRRVLNAIEGGGTGRLGVLEAAAGALTPPGTPAADDSRARAWVDARGWDIGPDEPLVAHLAGAWAACDDAGIGLDEARMDAYADAVEQIARLDVATVPPEPEGAVRQVVLGTVLVDPVLVLLRRLAQQHVAVRGHRGVS